MTYTLDQFSSACHDILKADPGVAGRRKICALLQDVLKDRSFLDACLTDAAPERKVLYEDPELGFCILAHVYQGAKESQPHDHGPSWAIYGQALGETEMTDWEVVEPPSDGKRGKARAVRTYALKPGAAHLYNEGDLHSPRRVAATRLIRIEGINMDKVHRIPFDRVS
jgi:hypothetical protein